MCDCSTAAAASSKEFLLTQKTKKTFWKTKPFLWLLPLELHTRSSRHFKFYFFHFSELVGWNGKNSGFGVPPKNTWHTIRYIFCVCELSIIEHKYVASVIMTLVPWGTLYKQLVWIDWKCSSRHQVVVVHLIQLVVDNPNFLLLYTATRWLL